MTLFLNTIKNFPEFFNKSSSNERKRVRERESERVRERENKRLDKGER